MSGRPELISPRNQHRHLARALGQRVEKELLRRNDRRKNFEAGESTGLCLALGAVGLLVSWNGAMTPEPWERISLAAMGTLLLLTQYFKRKTFYRHAEAPLIGAQKRKHDVDNLGS